ncbi:MAG: dGTP triphosphohydrolase [Candidatus Methylumidiphilus sp.]
MYDADTLEFAKGQENIIEKLEYRANTYAHGREEHRDFSSIDYARVLYSSSFRRLQGKMQLLGIDPNNFNRNRLTHSLEVAQIARSIATSLKLKSPVVSEACSLCHDIGNPPFGHYGEIILNELSQDVGGFEGNAQAFRILRLLEKKHHAYKGLNLT